MWHLNLPLQLPGTSRKLRHPITFEEVQVLEGTVVNVPQGNSPHNLHGETVEVDTAHILFVAVGIYDGLDRIISQRINEENLGLGVPASEYPDQHATSLAYQAHQSAATSAEEDNAEKDAYLKQVQARDLIEFGMIPEFLGMFPVLVPLHSLNTELLFRILTEPHNALVSQYQLLFHMDEVDLTFSPESSVAIARHAMKHNTGARGLRAVMGSVLHDPVFEIPGSDVMSVHITEDVVSGASSPVYIRGIPASEAG